MPGSDEVPGSSEEQVAKELQATLWTYYRFHLEWKALYAGIGLDPTDQQMRLDAERVVAADRPLDGFPGDTAPAESRETYKRAYAFLHAAKELMETQAIAKSEWAYNRDPDVLNEALRRQRELGEDLD